MDSLQAGLYARVSTADQQILPLQITAMREYAEHRGWIVAVVAEEIGSGARSPKHQELMKMTKRGQIDVVVVWKLARWGRSLQDLVNILAELTSVGVGFVCVTQDFDLTTPAGKLMSNMLAAFAEFERDILRERVKAG